MQMAKNESLRIAKATMAVVEGMPGEERTEFIDLIFDQYRHSKKMLYHKSEVRKFYDLLSKLVKTFGH